MPRKNIFLMAVLLLAACSRPKIEIETPEPIYRTITPAKLYTYPPTITPTRTSTLTSTMTNTPTITPTITFTITMTPSPTKPRVITSATKSVKATKTTITKPTTVNGNCSPAYPTVCIPPPPPDLDCKDIPYRKFKVLPPDPHKFDTDHDGIGCES